MSRVSRADSFDGNASDSVSDAGSDSSRSAAVSDAGTAEPRVADEPSMAAAAHGGASEVKEDVKVLKKMTEAELDELVTLEVRLAPSLGVVISLFLMCVVGASSFEKVTK